MATGRQVQLTKQVGEYLVAAELSRRGLLTATFAGNVPDYDIVATGSRGQTALVQVKAIAGPSWQFDIRTFVDVRCQAGAQTMGQPTTPPAGDLICVCVRLHTYGADPFYVLRWPELHRVLINGHRGYLERHGGRRPKPKRADSFHAALRETHIEPFTGQLVALRRVHGGLKDGSWGARRPQRAPLAAAGAGPANWAGSSTTTRGRRAGGFSRTRWLDPILGRETVDQPGHVGIKGDGGHEPRPRAPAASRPSHERPGGRVPRPCRLATWQEGRVARLDDNQGLIAIGVDRSVWLDARGEDVPGQLVGPVQRAGVHGPVRRPVEPCRPGLPVADAGLGQRAARPPAARAGVGAVAVVALVVHGPAGPHGGGGSTGRTRAPYMCTRPPLVAPHTSPSRRLRTFHLPVAPARANVDGRRLPAAATTRRNPAHDPARDRLDHHPR